jgi:hypothetical protein
MRGQCETAHENDGYNGARQRARPSEGTRQAQHGGNERHTWEQRARTVRENH